MDLSIGSLSMLPMANHDQRIWNCWNYSWWRCWSKLWNERFFTSQCGAIGGNSFIVVCCVSGQYHQYILHGSFANENQVQCHYWLCHVSKVVIWKIKCCWTSFSLQNTQQYKLVAPQNHMPLPNSPHLGHKNQACHSLVDSTSHYGGCWMWFDFCKGD